MFSEVLVGCFAAKKQFWKHQVLKEALTVLSLSASLVDSYQWRFDLQETIAGEPRSSAAARFAARLADFAVMRSDEVTGLALRLLAARIHLLNLFFGISWAHVVR